MALKLLIADPDLNWLESSKEFFASRMYEVDAVQNGKSAQSKLYNEEYFAVIINFSIKNHSAPEVLKFVKASHRIHRVVLILDNEKLLEDGSWTIDKLIKAGATEILVKPFEMEHLSDVLEGHQTLKDLVKTIPRKEGQSEEETVEQDDDKFTEIKIDEFYSSKAVLFDIYIKLGKGKYIKILHAGDTFSRERIDRYKNDKGIDCLYFHNSDRRKYIQYLNFIGTKLSSATNVSDASKMKLLQSTADKFLEETYTEGLKPQVVEQGKQLANSIFNMVEKKTDLWKVLQQWQKFDPNAYSHSYLVTIYSAGIIKQFEWQSRTMIETAAMAALFHDIGKMKLPPEIASKRPSEMNEEELAQYKRHPELGLEILDGHLMLNQSIKQIVHQHHEAFDGSGFPTGMKGNKVLTLANILCLADDFVHKMIDEKTNPVETLRNLLKDREKLLRYNSLIVENFIKVFSDPGKIGKDYQLPTNSRVVPNKKAS